MMKQEEKDLFIKDICARLPYNLMVEYKGETYNVLGITHGRLVLCKPFMSYTLDEHPLVQEVKPYLFPLSSMTEQQYEELNDNILGSSVSFDNKNEVIYDMRGYSKVYLSDVQMIIDWLYKNHFDVNNLIENGLAIDCTNLNIY